MFEIERNMFIRRQRFALASGELDSLHTDLVSGSLFHSQIKPPFEGVLSRPSDDPLVHALREQRGVGGDCIKVAGNNLPQTAGLLSEQTIVWLLRKSNVFIWNRRRKREEGRESERLSARRQ